MKAKIPPPVLLLITGTIMWFVAHSDFALPFTLRYSIVVAVAFALCGITIDLLAIRQFRREQTTINPLKPEAASALVSDGIFNKTRNPMYLGLIFILAGWAIWLGSWSNIAVLALFVVVINELQIKPEEAALHSLFGQRYTEYCDQVRRWI